MGYWDLDRNKSLKVGQEPLLPPSKDIAIWDLGRCGLRNKRWKVVNSNSKCGNLVFREIWHQDQNLEGRSTATPLKNKVT